MNTPVHEHICVIGGSGRDRRAYVDALSLAPALLPPVGADRRLRGPYTAAGSVVRALVPAVLTSQPELAARYDIEVLSVAPELGPVLPCSRETLTSLAIPAERTRFYARLRTQRISHGLVELLTGALPVGAPSSLVVTDLDQADPTDVEFVLTALRRIDPARLTLVICLDETLLEDGTTLTQLTRHARLDTSSAAAGPPADPPAGPATQGPLDAAELAALFVDGDGTCDDERARAAYLAMPAPRRAELHDRRAHELASIGEFSTSLGAIPYHRERGLDPHGAGVAALHAALEYCVCLGFYDAVVDLGLRGLALVDARANPGSWWVFNGSTGLALSILGRTREAGVLFERVRAQTTNPKIHMALAYSLAMLYTRHNDPAERSEEKAKAWLNAAIATASLVAEPAERAFLSAFYRNGLALVEVNLGDSAEALALVDDCIDSLDRLLTPDDHRLHRTVLKNNRARVYAMLGRLDEALADYAVVIAADPNHAEHYLERGAIFRRLGRFTDALADYGTGIRLSPPFVEIYYNRADLKLTMGDESGALADLDYTLELDPECVDAYLNRAGILLARQDLAGAGADILTGLALDPDNAYLRVAFGQLLAERGDHRGAIEQFDRVLAVDPESALALAGRASSHYERADFASAVEDLTRAVELTPGDPALRFNLATALVEQGRSTEALDELTVAAALAPDDEDIAILASSVKLAVAV